jgi:hypothetical protein
MENELETINGNVIKKVEAFSKKINEHPAATEIKVNKAAGNSKYLPISFIEMSLDEIFLGQWDFEFKGFQVIANEIVGYGLLTVTHPITGREIKRSGTAAVMIQQKKDSDITDISAKYKNTLVKDFPHLESECLKSAARKLGKLFGRDLNREHEDEFESPYTADEEKKAVRLQILDCKTEDELKELWNSKPELHTDKSFKTSINSRILEIKSFDNANK